MKVILLKDVKKQGKKDQIIEVSDGYAQNFLIKNGLAVKYTNSSKNILEKELENKKQQEEKFIEECQKLKEKIEKITLTYKVKTGKDGKVFGSVSTKQIIEELIKNGIKIDKKTVEINNPIDTLGTHFIKANLHKKVVATIKVLLKEV